MLRTLATRRAVNALAQSTSDALTAQVKRLRGSPLAIRWYVEAVGAGGDPGVVMSDQSSLLRFCLETIYADLSETARHCLGVMYAAGSGVDAAQLAVITDAAPDLLTQLPA